MSAASLQTQIKEDYLTCAICCDNFIKPKALPCIHTFCESCLRDYVASRSYVSNFPCPTCRKDCLMPTEGVEGFPNNHLMSSLSDTVDQAQAPRPVPKPRKSMGGTVPAAPQPIPGNNASGASPSYNLNDANNCHMMPFDSGQTKADFYSGSEVVDRSQDDGSSVDNTPPPPYSSVADSKICSNDDDHNNWMFVPKQTLPSHTNVNPVSYPYPPAFPSTGGGWNVATAPPMNDGQSHNRPHEEQFKSNDNNTVPLQNALYPCVPTNFESAIDCSENLMLRFGKKGSSPRDFVKPSSLAVHRSGEYVILDKDGDENRILIFNSGGEITTAFKCGAKVKDIAMTQNGDIIGSVDKHTSALRIFTTRGQLRGEFGKFFTFEKPSGIAELKNKGIAITGIEGNCVYILTPQMKLATKFGRKGNGDGYFLHPSFVAVNSKEHIIVTDKVNGCVQVFNSEGKFKHRFGSNGQKTGQLSEPLGLCIDFNDNIIIADSGNFRVEVFSSGGHWLCSVVKDTHQLGENVKPVGVAMTPTGKIAVLLCGAYFAEVRVYSVRIPHVPRENPAPNHAWLNTSAMWSGVEWVLGK